MTLGNDTGEIPGKSHSRSANQQARVFVPTWWENGTNLGRTRHGRGM